MTLSNELQKLDDASAEGADSGNENTLMLTLAKEAGIDVIRLGELITVARRVAKPLENGRSEWVRITLEALVYDGVSVYVDPVWVEVPREIMEDAVTTINMIKATVAWADVRIQRSIADFLREIAVDSPRFEPFPGL